MRPTRVLAILLFAFLFGGSSAEVAVKAKRAIDRHRTCSEEGSAGDLVAFEIHREGGELLARPRVIASPGRTTELVLRNPEDASQIRLSLRVETTREPSGDLSIDYEFAMPGEDLDSRGHVSVTPGVEQQLELGEHPLVTTIFSVPVPSAAFDAYLEHERAARAGFKPI
ncbi:MAG TPA: hypothetical protein VMK12_29980 [Anaeromyxobacteraceae bacterium]|nr:hypothetical protein [Anaeromyxobacteraceae bacterium]